MNRIYTHTPLWRRPACKYWGGAILAVAVFFGLVGIAEAGCELLGAGYDARIEVAA